MSTRDVLLQKAVDSFYRDGFTKASIRKICSESNVSNAALYNYFRSKDDLLFEIVFSIGAELIAILRRILQEVDDPKEALAKMLMSHICLIKKRKKEIKIFIEELHQLSRDLRTTCHKQHREVYDLYYGVLRRLAQDGRMSADDLTIDNFVIFGMVNWCYRWYKEGGRLSIEEIAKKLIDILFHGILRSEKEPD